MEKHIEILNNVVKFLDSSGKNVETQSMSSSDIISIRIEECTVSGFFKKIQTKRIILTAQGIDKRLEVYENKVGTEAFAQYAAELSAFAKRYHISLITP